MIDETDPAVALQAAMFAACTNSAALQAIAGGVRVFDRVSVSVFPFVRIGEDLVSPDDSACGSVSEVFSTVRAYSRRPGLVEVKQIAAVLQDLLDMRTGDLDVDGFRLVVGNCEGVSFERHADGLTTQAIVNFRYRLAPVATPRDYAAAGLLGELVGAALAAVKIKATASATLGDLVGAGEVAGLPLPADLVGEGALGECPGAALGGRKNQGDRLGDAWRTNRRRLGRCANQGDRLGDARRTGRRGLGRCANQGDRGGDARRIGRRGLGRCAIKAAAAATLGELTGSASGTVTASGPTFESGVIHAWDPVGGADGSGIIADAVGGAPMYVRSGLSAVADWNGTLTGGAGINEVLCVDNDADTADFFAEATPTITFWLYEEATSGTYAGIAGVSTNGYLPGGGTKETGDFTVGRSNTYDCQVYVWGGYAAGGRGLNPRENPAGQWNLWTLRLGAGKWAVLGNDAVTLRSISWQSAVFDSSAAISIGATGGYADHTAYMGSAIIGQYGDVRLWDKSLSDAEIIALHTAGRQTY